MKQLAQAECSSQLAASLLTTCNRLVIIKPEQAMQTHPDIGLVIADLLQRAHFGLCNSLTQDMFPAFLVAIIAEDLTKVYRKVANRRP